MDNNRLTRTSKVGITITTVFAIALIWLWHIVSDFPAALEPNQHRSAGVLIDNVRLISMVPGAPDKAGLSPHQALASATRISAQTLGFEQTGMIAPGYRANLVLLPEDPLIQIGAVEFPAAVMLGGYWMDDSKLEELREAARDTSLTRSVWRALQMKL